MNWLELKDIIISTTENSVDEFKNELGDDVDKFKEKLSDALSDAAEALEQGENIDDILNDLDTEATFLLSSSLSNLGEHKIRLAKATAGVLEQIVWTIIVKAILHP